MAVHLCRGFQRITNIPYVKNGVSSHNLRKFEEVDVPKIERWIDRKMTISHICDKLDAWTAWAIKTLTGCLIYNVIVVTRRSK